MGLWTNTNKGNTWIKEIHSTLYSIKMETRVLWNWKERLGAFSHEIKVQGLFHSWGRKKTNTWGAYTHFPLNLIWIEHHCPFEHYWVVVSHDPLFIFNLFLHWRETLKWVNKLNACLIDSVEPNWITCT